MYVIKDQSSGRDRWQTLALEMLQSYLIDTYSKSRLNDWRPTFEIKNVDTRAPTLASQVTKAKDSLVWRIQSFQLSCFSRFFPGIGSSSGSGVPTTDRSWLNPPES